MKLNTSFTAVFTIFLCLMVSIDGGSYVKRQQEHRIHKKNKTEHGDIKIKLIFSKMFSSRQNQIDSVQQVFRRQRNGTRTISPNRSTNIVDNAGFKNETGHFPNKIASHLSRKRRYNYEDTYEWNEDDQLLEYDVDENSIMQKIGRHWKKVAASICFVGAGLILACICGRIAWVVCLPYIKDACYMTYCPILHACYKEYEICCKDDADQLERDFRTVANMLGIRLTLEDFQAIKEHYGFDGGKHIQDFDSVKSAAKKYDVDAGVPLI